MDPPIVYLFNATTYELSVRDRRELGRTVVGERTLERLARTDLGIRNRTTGDVTRFAVTYVPGTAAPLVPVQIFFSPSFWLRVELRADDAVDAPLEPTLDPAVLARLRQVCRDRTSER